MASSKYTGSFTYKGATFSWEGPGDSVGVKGLDAIIGSPLCNGTETEKRTFQTLSGAKSAARAYYDDLTDIDKAWARGDVATVNRLRRASEREQSLYATQRAEREAGR